jgi:hypothetical protein
MRQSSLNDPAETETEAMLEKNYVKLNKKKNETKSSQSKGKAKKPSQDEMTNSNLPILKTRMA